MAVVELWLGLVLGMLNQDISGREFHNRNSREN